MASSEISQELPEGKPKKRKRQRSRLVVPTTIRYVNDTINLGCLWAPAALAPVVIYDLKGKPRLLTYAMRMAPGRGAPQRTYQALGIWLSYHFRRLAGLGHWPAIDDIAKHAGLTSHCVRNSWREGKKLGLAAFPVERLHFSALERLFASCDMLVSGAKFPEVPVPSNTDPLEMQRLAIRLVQDANFRNQTAADQYLEPAEVAKLLRRPVNWLAKMRMTSEGPAFIKCGRKILYRQSTVESWLAAAERRSTRKAA